MAQGGGSIRKLGTSSLCSTPPGRGPYAPDGSMARVEGGAMTGRSLDGNIVYSTMLNCRPYARTALGCCFVCLVVSSSYLVAGVSGAWGAKPTQYRIPLSPSGGLGQFTHVYVGKSFHLCRFECGGDVHYDSSPSCTPPPVSQGPAGAQR